MVRRRTRFPLAALEIDRTLLAAFLVTLVAGLVLIYSASSVMAEARFGSNFYFLRQQVLWTLISLVVATVLVKIDLNRFAVYSPVFLLVTMFFLALVFIMPARNDSHRWIFLGPLTFQPSELFKFVAIVYLAFSLANPRRDIAKLRDLLLPYAPLIGAGLILTLLEPDLGRTIIMFVIVVAMLFLAGARIKHLATAFLPLAGVASFVVFVLGYKKARVVDYLTAIQDPLTGSYQSSQAALTIGSGGMFGLGLGEGTQKLFFLPYPHTDFIFAATGQEFGFLGLLILLLLLFTIIYRGLKIATAQPDKFGYLLASGMTLSIFVNVAINVGVVTSLIPVTGSPLPFISYGGSSLVVNCAAVGVLLNLSRRMVK
jgi:cell division protein FtsW